MRWIKAPKSKKKINDSHFGDLFLKAAKESGIRHSLDFFDGSMIKVQKDDFPKFLENLLKLSDSP